MRVQNDPQRYVYLINDKYATTHKWEKEGLRINCICTNGYPYGGKHECWCLNDTESNCT